MSVVSREVIDGRLVITVDNAPVNALSHAVREGLVEALATVDGGIDSVIIRCAGRTFFSGADISEFGKPPKAPSLLDVLDAIEACPAPVIAAIHGQALGGGFEVALACDYRVLDAKAKIGLPEVALGLIPGAGGTQRTPRLAGVDFALKLAVTGKPVDAVAALAAGAVDMVAEDDLLGHAMGLSHKGERQKRRLSALPGPEVDEAAFKTWTGFADKRLRGQKSPHAVIAAVRAACEMDFAAGMAEERRQFQACMADPQSSALRYLFFAERQAPKPQPSISDAPRALKTIGVIGAGTMGVGIAASMLAAGYDVRLFDVHPDALNVGHDRILAIIDGDLKKNRISPDTHTKRRSALSKVADWSGFAGCDVVIEAVFEDMAIKAEVFAALDKVVSADTILASNTSYLDIDAMADKISHPERFLGLHFFSPAHIMKLLEVVRGAKTSGETLVSALAMAKRAKKVAAISGVCHGFIGNRMISGYAREAGLLLLEGASPKQIDAALYGFGMPMGPFTMGDMAGLDIGYANRRKLDPDQVDNRAFLVHDQLVVMGHKGQKTGKGFYLYESGSRTPQDDPLTQEIIDAVRTREGVTPRDIDEAEIVDRCVLALVNEGARILEEGIAQRGSDIDVVYANGYGFPRWRGGPMCYADQTGLDKIAARIKSFETSQGGRWWRLAPLIAELAETGGRLSQWERKA